VAPNSGQAGQTVSVTITGSYTNFVLGATQANFGPYISVGGALPGTLGPVTVTNSTSATAQLAISATAAPGDQELTVATGLQQESLAQGFAVAPAYIGRLVGQATLQLPDGFAANLSADARKQFLAEGYQIDDQQNALIGPQGGLPGYWVKIVGDVKDDNWYMTDRDGNFRVSQLPQGAKTVLFYGELSDTAPEAQFPLERAGNPPTYTLKITLPMPADMNDATAADASLPLEGAGNTPTYAFKITPSMPIDMNGATDPSSPPIGEAFPNPPDACTQLGSPPGCQSQSQLCLLTTVDSCPCRCNAQDSAVTNNTKGCCLDYDGPPIPDIPGSGDRLPREHDPAKLVGLGAIKSNLCEGLAKRNFILSTCNKWSFDPRLGFACKNEFAYLGKGYPICYIKHKYRNCQSMKIDDFSVSPNHNIKIAPRSTIKIRVRNNTPDNSSIVSVSDGTLGLATTGPALQPLGKGTWQLAHYSESLKKHFEGVDLSFTAPSLPKGTCSEAIVFNAIGGGFDLRANINVVDSDPNCGQCPHSSLQFGLLSNTLQLSGTQQCPSVPTVLAVAYPDTVCVPEVPRHYTSLAMNFYSFGVTCQQWDPRDPWSQILFANQSWLSLYITSDGMDPQSPIGPGTYRLDTFPDDPFKGGITVDARQYKTDAQCTGEFQTPNAKQSGTVTINSITSTSVEGHIDAVVDGVPYTGDFTAIICAPMYDPCPRAERGPVTCLPGPSPTAALRAIRPKPDRAFVASGTKAEIARKAGDRMALLGGARGETHERKSGN
jgi:hypothetical protein